MTVYDFKATLLDGEPVQLDKYRDNVLLIVNVASRCGFTPQYAGLEKLYGKYRQQGFFVLGFPSNQFGSQEPGSADEIKTFCQSQYGITFPLFAKTDVNGSNAHPLYDFLKREQPGILGTLGIKWNFTKFLVGRQGHPIKRFGPQDKPESLERDIEAALKVEGRSV